MTNNLLGILLRFRKESIAVTADIEQMFYCFLVREDHRNFLRFLWYRNNNPDEDLIEYRMRVHVFGNSPSPVVATYCLRRTAANSEIRFGPDVKEFIERNFYVDDGLASLPTSEQAIDLMKRTQEAIKTEGNLRLHKIASNSEDVMKAFASEDLSKNLKDLDFADDTLPLQRSLGLSWDLKSDTFTFRVSTDKRPYTRRGILSVVNSLYDPLGLVAPVTVQGKLFLRNSVSGSTDWDDPFPNELHTEWETWKDSLQHLEQLQIPRSYTSTSLSDAIKKEVHIFSDASEKAIAAVAYLVTTAQNGSRQIGFVLGKAKVAPMNGHTIPRLELCAAVLAVEVSEIVADHLDIPPDAVQFYTDSKVVLGYINNRIRRFYMYVSNRVERIRKTSKPEQWSYISTERNPADYATRSVPASKMQESPWLLGPVHLVQTQNKASEGSFSLMDPDNDKELRPMVNVLKTNIPESNSLGSHRFERFSSWKILIETFARLRHISSFFRNEGNCHEWHMCSEHKAVEVFHETEKFIIKVTQREQFENEFACKEEEIPLPKGSPLLPLNPAVDRDGLLRVGGRLNRADLDSNTKNPLIIPGQHHLATLLVRHYHAAVRHQGRHFTEGAIRAAGLWIIGGKRLISSVIHKCLKCRKMRGKQEMQKMSDLPRDRLEPGPPFTSVGVDTFGPWQVVTRRTRGGQANSKRWAILFTCLTTRAIHIEVIEELSSSSFINALRRLIAIRGNVKEFRSDRGTNFIGATDILKVDTVNVEDGQVKNFLYNNGTVWIFNPPHSSHMGGVWERMIGVTRRILDAMLSDVSAKNLTHEVLTTFMAEVCAIVNARPIVPVTSDPESPHILSPSVLLTQKLDSTTQPLKGFDKANLYKAQWKRVQTLADIFWNRWRHEYLTTLQKRRKWQFDKPNIRNGDIVLLKDVDVCRNEWPMGIIVNAIPGEDEKVRKAEVRVVKNGKRTVYTRPISEMVLLLSDDSSG